MPPTKDELKAKLTEYENKGDDVAACVRGRLKIIKKQAQALDAERKRLEALLRSIRRAPASTVSSYHERVYSPLGRCILDVIDGAGTQGLYSSEICAAVANVLNRDVNPASVQTFLARAKRKDMLFTVGPRNAYRYVLNRASG